MANNKNTKQNKNSNISYMWWKLPLIKDTTNMIKGKWSDNKSKDIKGNHAVLTGEENNITGVDLDFSYKLTNDELNSNPITKKFIDLFGKEPNWDTYTVRTRSGGLHYYFEYEPDLKQTQDDDTKIDIRGKGGCLYGAGTVVKKGDKQGEYKCINDKKQMKMPNDLKVFLLEHLYTKKTKTKTHNQIEKKINKNKNIKMYNESYYEYDFSDDLLRRIFDGLPNDYWECVVAQDGAPSFLTWTAACKSLDCEDLWDEYNEKHDGYDYDKNLSLWDSANENYNCFQNLLRYTSFPNADKLIDYHKYQPIIQNEIKPDKTFNSQKVGYDYFKEDKNYILKSDTGTGKTTSFQKYIERTNQKFISITSRVSLADDQYTRFSKEINGVYYYKDLVPDVKGKLLGQSDERNKYGLSEFVFHSSVVVEIESLITRLEYAESIKNLNEMVVYLDEFNSLIKHIHTSSTLDNTLTFILEQFIYILKNCKQIICTDADISDTCILWFKENIGREFEFHKNEYKHNKNIKAHEILCYDTMIDQLHKSKKWIVPCDSRVNALTLHKQFPDATLIIAETSDIPNLDDHDRIIYSPKILYGVDSIMKREVFCFFQERTIDPEQMLQMVCRCRNITKLHYLFLRKSFKPKDIDFNNLWDDMLKMHSTSLQYFKNRYFKHLEKGYLNTLHRIEYDKKCYSSNPYSHFKKLIKERGFEDNDLYKNTSSASFHLDKKELKEETLQKEIDNFNIKDEKYEKVNKILKLDEKNANEFKMFLIDKNLLNRHWNISTMFFNKDIDVKFDDFDYFAENFTINKMANSKTKLKLLQDMKIESDCLDPYDITPKKIFNNKLLEDYKTIFRSRSKTLKSDTVYDCQKIIVGMYKNLFGDIIKSTSNKKKGSKIKYSINNEALEQDRKLFGIRSQVAIKVRFVKDIQAEREQLTCDLDL
jgi:hypothetical protein